MAKGTGGTTGRTKDTSIPGIKNSLSILYNKGSKFAPGEQVGFDDNLSNESIPNPNSELGRSFRQTNLDLEDARVLGGPNRTGDGGDGFYTVQGDNSDNPLSVGGVPLKNDDGTLVTKQIHPYTPQRTYLQTMNGEEILDPRPTANNTN
tara:strand:+ start:502 stop:948 length:447 start_codon:yes stop_codon:yes gene_type:complete